MLRRLPLPIALAALLLCSSTLAAQKTPKRPRLADGDTNSARAYVEEGFRILEKDPRGAADAYYWAIRIDPSMADAFYGRRTAMMMAEPRRLLAYDRGSRGVMQSEEMQRLDSLLSQAFLLNPMLPMRLERMLTLATIKAYVEEGGGPPLTLSDQMELQMWFDRYVRSAYNGAALRARMEQSSGNNTRALQFYADAIKSNKKNAELRAARGRLFLQIGEADSALNEIKLALEELRKRDKKDFVVFYNSKAMLELTTGIAHETRGEKALAKEAYGRALQEDLAYYPAHVRLGFLALGDKDTTTALSEMELAVQLRPDDAVLRDRYGYSLLVVGKTDSALVQLNKAVELEPYYALPRRHLGEAYEMAQKAPEAKAAYKAFLATASRTDPMRNAVEKQLAGLGAIP
ncbi:MAG TPA: hypothetical protein VFT29_06490 [Gemmatimonadaceae bacterium]|nr:hypothetical protein [Gemmatimonadaceae bacterium]